MGIERFEDLVAWQKARDLTKEIYLKTGEGHFSKDYGLRDQMLFTQSLGFHGLPAQQLISFLASRHPSLQAFKFVQFVNNVS